MGGARHWSAVERRGQLTIGPRLLYPGKAVLTRTRSAWWRIHSSDGAAGAGIRILFYHRVADEPDELAVPTRAFAAQMDLLARNGYRVLDVATAGEALASGADVGRVVGLSFDDAYLDVAEHAEPVLARLGFRATVFVATGVTDGRTRFSWYAAQPPLMSWADIERLDGGVFSFEPHSVTHPSLPTLDEPEARREIEESKAELERHVGRSTSVFCYPAGLAGPRERRLVAAAGFRFAVSCEPGVNDGAGDPLFLSRVQVDRRDSLLDFRAKVGGGHDRPLPLRRAWRRVRYGAAASNRA